MEHYQEQQYPPGYYQQQPPHQYEQHQQHSPQGHMSGQIQPDAAYGYSAPQPVHNQEKFPSQQQPSLNQPMDQYQNHQHQHQHQQDKAPARRSSSKWAFGLFDCFSPLDTCCLSFWCPCYLFGKTYERNTTGQKDPSGMNGMCCAYCVTLYFGCAPIVQCMQRQSTREKHGINGGCFEDFCTSCCCACCALIQEEKESIVRVTDTDPKTGAVYQPVQAMNYA